MKYPEKMLLKLPDGFLARIDAASSNRSDFVRSAIEAALGGDVAPVVPAEPVDVHKDVDRRVAMAAPVDKRSSDRFRADDDALLDYVRSHPRVNVRSICEGLGWFEVRVSKGIARLGSLGLVRFSGGFVEAV